MYTKTNRNSYGQFLRSRERTFWMSATVTPPSVAHPHGLIHRPGSTYKKPKG